MHAVALTRPYAQAAFRTARRAGTLAQWSEALGALRDALARPDLAALLADPRVDRDAVATRLGQALAGALPQDAVRFAGFLAERGLLPALSGLVEQFEALRRAHETRVKLVVTVARPLDETQTASLRAAAARALSAEVDIETHVDAQLIGGAVLRIGDRVIDGSVRGRLEQLAAALKA